MLEPTQGPPLRVISTYPEDGAGLDCSIDDLGCGVPINTPIEIRFDRFLLPSTATRQSVAIYVGADPSNAVPPPNQFAQLTPRYDLVERVVTYELPSGTRLRPNTLYTVELTVPVYDGDFGFRAFDDALLDPDTTTELRFLTSNQAEMEGPGEASATCSDVVRTFDGCVGGSCHGTSGHVMGMNLSRGDAISQTAVGRVAHEAETGSTTGPTKENPARFGVSMPRIDPGRPDNSYLMYKLLVAPENYRKSGASNPDYCGSRHRAPPDPVSCVPPTADEIERLQEWFLRGVPMPRLKDDKPAPEWLRRDDLLGIDSWIAAGASCP